MVTMDATLWNHIGSWKRDRKAGYKSAEGEGMEIGRWQHHRGIKGRQKFK